MGLRGLASICIVAVVASSCRTDRRGDDDDDDDIVDQDAGTGSDAGDEPPELMPHQNPINFGNFPPGAASQQFELIVANSGGGLLEITSVDVRGDVNCALSPAPAFDQDLPVRIASSEMAFLALTYVPGGDDNGLAGTRDQIAVALTSNDPNSPVLEISVCGCLIAGDPLEAPPCECSLSDVPELGCGE